MIQRVVDGLEPNFSVLDEVLKFGDKVCVPQDDDLRTQILIKVYYALYTTHLESVKIYQNLKRSFQWSNMKKVVADFVSRCMRLSSCFF